MCYFLSREHKKHVTQVLLEAQAIWRTSKLALGQSSHAIPAVADVLSRLT